MNAERAYEFFTRLIESDFSLSALKKNYPSTVQYAEFFPDYLTNLYRSSPERLQLLRKAFTSSECPYRLNHHFVWVPTCYFNGVATLAKLNGKLELCLED